MDKQDLSNKSTASSNPSSNTGEEPNKVLIFLQSIGSAIKLKENKFKVSGEKTLYTIEKHLRSKLKYEQTIYLYCGPGFSPTPEQTIQDLFNCFQTGGQLIVYYGFQETYG